MSADRISDVPVQHVEYTKLSCRCAQIVLVQNLQTIPPDGCVTIPVVSLFKVAAEARMHRPLQGTCGGVRYRSRFREHLSISSRSGEDRADLAWRRDRAGRAPSPKLPANQ